MPNVLPDAAVDQFRADALKILPENFGTLGLCVSGGPDSIAMLMMARAAGFQCEAITIDHGLREEAANEARMVSAICHDAQVTHEIKRIDGKPTGNVSEWARKARYAAIDGWADARGLTWLMTAHHADDQLETILMRLNRGAGLGGLSGVRKVNGRYVRPLLGWRKAELVALLDDAQIAYADDPSNRDDRYDRARMRKELHHAAWLDPLAAARSASALDDANQALEWAVDRAAEVHLVFDGPRSVLDPQHLPAEIVRRLVTRCLHSIAGKWPLRGPDVDRLIAALLAGRITTLAGVKCRGGETWTFEIAPARKRGKVT